MDATRIVQETMHWIKQKKLPLLILKLYLEKADGKVDLSFLRLILVQIGMPLKVTQWIMSCVNSASFAVLINGSPSAFFKGSRGIRQGCPLSPYLFLLVIGGLSLLLHDAKEKGAIKGVKITGSIFLTHIPFLLMML